MNNIDILITSVLLVLLHSLPTKADESHPPQLEISTPHLDSFAQSPNGQWIMWSERIPDNSPALYRILIMDLVKPAKPVVLAEKTSEIVSVCFSPKSDRLTATLFSGTLLSWTIPQMRREEIRTPFARPWTVASSDSLLVVSSLPSSVWLHRADAEFRLIGKLPSVPCFATAAIGGQYIAAGDIEGNIHVWKAKDGSLSWRALSHVDPKTKRVGIQGFGLTDAGETLLTGGTDGFVRYWSTRLGTALKETNLGIGEIDTMALSRDTRRLAAAGVTFGTSAPKIKIAHLDLSTGRISAVGTNWPSRIRGLGFHPDSKHLLVAYGGKHGKIVASKP